MNYKIDKFEFNIDLPPCLLSTDVNGGIRMLELKNNEWAVKSGMTYIKYQNINTFHLIFFINPFFLQDVE